MSHSKNCILASGCRQRDTRTCNSICEPYIIMHGKSGAGGRIGNAEVPQDYRLITAINSPVRENQAEVYTTIDAYIKTFIRQFEASGERIKSLYLYSKSPGTGKTTTACAVLNEYIIRHYIGCLQRGQRPLERPAFFLDVNEMQTLYNQFNRNKVPEEIAAPAADKYYRWIKLAQETPFAVFDDIGVRQATEGFRADLHTLINARVTNKLPTVYTSNIPIAELSSVFGEERLADRVRDMCLQISFSGSSKRGKR